MAMSLEKSRPDTKKEHLQDAEKQSDNYSAPSDFLVDKRPDEKVVLEETKHLAGWSMGILSLGLCVTTFLVGLDMMIIATVCL
jgi:hypothetical protein